MFLLSSSVNDLGSCCPEGGTGIEGGCDDDDDINGVVGGGGGRQEINIVMVNVQDGEEKIIADRLNEILRS